MKKKFDVIGINFRQFVKKSTLTRILVSERGRKTTFAEK